jgi:hypothetical protein
MGWWTSRLLQTQAGVRRLPRIAQEGGQEIARLFVLFK